jgi:hypothetical protein
VKRGGLLPEPVEGIIQSSQWINFDLPFGLFGPWKNADEVENPHDPADQKA